MPSSKTILEKVCGNNKKGTVWIHSQSSRSMHAIQREQPGNLHNHNVC